MAIDNNIITRKARKAAIQRLAAAGISQKEFAEKIGVAYQSVRRVLNSPRSKCIRGESHKIAVALGLKKEVPLEQVK